MKSLTVPFKIFLTVILCSSFGEAPSAARLPEAGQDSAATPGYALRVGADWLDIATYRDSYSQTGFHSYTLEWDFVTRGADGSFSAAYNHPVFGLGFTYSDLSKVKFTSPGGRYEDMLAVYARASRELLRRGTLFAGYDLSLGLSYSGAYFDPLTNSDNWFIGAPVLIYVDAGAHVGLQVGRRMDLLAEVAVRHHSSARTAYPNGGLNYWGGGVSARYHLSDRPSLPRTGSPRPRIDSSLYTKGWCFEIYAGGGVHACAAEWRAYTEILDAEGLSQVRLHRFPMGTLGFDALYRLGGRIALGASATAFYCSNMETLRWADGIIYGESEAERSSYAPFSFGIGAVQEFFYKNVALYIQEGFYLYRKAGIHGDHGRIYERAGLRFYPEWMGPFFFGMSIKAHLFKADYLDFNVGVRLK